jgi:hypothetical protein
MILALRVSQVALAFLALSLTGNNSMSLGGQWANNSFMAAMGLAEFWMPVVSGYIVGVRASSYTVAGIVVMANFLYAFLLMGELLSIDFE